MARQAAQECPSRKALDAKALDPGRAALLPASLQRSQVLVRLHRATAAAAAACTITATASAIADAASAALFSAADAACRHPWPSTAGRRTPPPVAAGASSAVLGALSWLPDPPLPSPPCPAAAQKRLDLEQPDPFERLICPLSSWLDRPLCAQTLRVLCGSPRTTSAAACHRLTGSLAARPAEDAAGGRQRAAVRAAAHAHACASQSHDPVPLNVILRLLPWRGGRIRQEPISSTSFWQGLYFAVQKDLDDSLHRCAYSLYPADTRSSPQSRAEGRRVQLPGGAGSIRACTGRLRARSQRQRNGTHCASNPRPSYPHAHHTQHSHEGSINLADCVFAHACLAPRPRSTGAIFACVIFAGSLSPRTNPCALFTRSLLVVRSFGSTHVGAACW